MSSKLNSTLVTPNVIENLQSSINITWVFSIFVLDTECGITLCSSSFHLVLVLDLDTAIGAEYRLKSVGLITPVIVDMEPAYPNS